jgi:integrase
MAVFKKYGNKWYFRFKIRGKEYYKSIPEATDQKSALQYEAIIKGELMKGNLGIIENSKKATLKEGVALYLEYSRNNKKSYKNDNGYTNSFLKFFKPNCILDDITPSLIEDYKKFLAKGNITKTTINRYLQALSKLLNVCVDNNLLLINPMRKVKLLKTDNHAIRFLTKEEEKILMSFLPKFYFSEIKTVSKLKLIVKFALKTGARKEEILSLKWENIDFKNNIIELLHTKSGKKRKIPLAKTLKKVLLRLKDLENSEYVFINPVTQKRYVDIKKAFNNAVKNSEIKKLRFHDLRHTFATRLIEKGVDIVVVKELLGHADIKTTMMYVHSDATRKMKAIEIIDMY